MNIFIRPLYNCVFISYNFLPSSIPHCIAAVCFRKAIKLVPFKTYLTFGDAKKSHGAISREGGKSCIETNPLDGQCVFLGTGLPGKLRYPIPLMTKERIIIALNCDFFLMLSFVVTNWDSYFSDSFFKNL